MAIKKNTKKENRKLVALMMTSDQISVIDTIGKTKNRNRSSQIRAMVQWILNNKRVLNSI